MALISLKQLDTILTGSLQVSGSAGVTGSLGLSGDILLDEDQRIYFEADKQTWMEANGANLVRIVTNNSQMLLLDHETGNRAVFGNGTKVFIGDNNNALPTKELEVVGDVSASGHISGSAIYSTGPITLEDSGPSTPNAKIIVKSSNNNLNIGDTIVLSDGNNRVGMGDSAPSSPDTELHIKSDTPVVTLQRTANTQKGAIDFQGQGGSVGASIEFVADTNDLSFQTFDGGGMHEKMRIQDGASGLIKVSGSTHITGSLYVSGAYYGDGSNLTGITSGIFQQTGSSQATTNDLQITGSLVATAAVTASNNVEVGGDLLVTEYIRHKGDVNTNIRFTDNRIRFNAGNMTFLGLHDDDDAPFTATINPGSNKINFKAMDENNDLLLKTNSETFKVELYYAGNEKLTTEAGGVNVTGHITASANISSSGTITGNSIVGTLTGTSTGLAGTPNIVVGTIEATSINTTNITSSFVTASTVHTSGSNIFGDEITDTHTFVGHITASNHISSSANIIAKEFHGDGSNLDGITSGIFQPTGSVQSATTDIQISGSLVISGSTLTVRTGTDSGPPTASTAIFTNNITNGYPTSNAWGEGLDGSYFNNFDNTSHVSEILRFMAGIISHSIDTSSPTANTKTFASVDTNTNSLGGTDSVDGYLPQDHTSLSNATINYLVHKDWVSAGTTIFSGISVYHDNGNTYSVDFDSNSGGSTSVRSSADTELFGLGGLTSGGPTQFDVKVIATQSFSDTGSISTPNASSNTFTTQSNRVYSTSSFGTLEGVTLAKIDSANPAVIPPAFQDGKFVNVGGGRMSGSLTRKYHATKGSFTSVSSSGYYNMHDLKVGIATGSGNFSFVNGTDKKYFWAPIDQIESDIGLNSLADVGTTHKVLTATSRSLSGVPYLIDATFEVSTKITGLFNPMYRASTTLVDMTAGSVGVGSVSISGDTISTSGGTIQTSGKVFQSDGSTPVNSGVPRYDDIAIVTASVSFDSGNDDNIQQSTTFTDSTFTVATKARNRANSQTTLDTQTITYHTAGNFGQPVASGSLGIYGRAQGYDGGALDGTTETFTGEDFRIQLADNVQEFNGTAWTTTYELSTISTGSLELQVKPGFLVDPGGDYRYWYPQDFNSHIVYKYYIRRFQTDGGTKTSMTVNLNNNTLKAWTSTDDGISCAILFESSGKNSGNNSALGTARIYDPTATTSNLIEADISNDNHKNPFSTAISLYGNSGGSILSNTYTIPIRNSDGMYLDSNDNELYIIVRYKGDPTPLDDITLTFS
jgi:hypothetical protein